MASMQSLGSCQEGWPLKHADVRMCRRMYPFYTVEFFEPHYTIYVVSNRKSVSSSPFHTATKDRIDSRLDSNDIHFLVLALCIVSQLQLFNHICGGTWGFGLGCRHSRRGARVLYRIVRCSCGNAPHSEPLCTAILYSRQLLPKKLEWKLWPTTYGTRLKSVALKTNWNQVNYVTSKMP